MVTTYTNKHEDCCIYSNGNGRQGINAHITNSIIMYLYLYINMYEYVCICMYMCILSPAALGAMCLCGTARSTVDAIRITPTSSYICIWPYSYLQLHGCMRYTHHCYGTPLQYWCTIGVRKSKLLLLLAGPVLIDAQFPNGLCVGKLEVLNLFEEVQVEG